MDSTFDNDAGTMACVAYVAARVVLGPCASQVYDHARELLVRVGGTVRGKEVGLYDYDRRCGFYGTLPDLWDDGERSRVTLNIDGHHFDGSNGARQRFRGRVEGSTVVLLDDSGDVIRSYTVNLMTPAGP